MDAFELLKNDHKKVSQLFKEIESASGQAKMQLFSRLKRELDVHAHIEEKVFYPALVNTDEARDITLEAYEEHKVVKDLLAELASGGAPNDEWDAKLTVLKENVEHHVEEEEGELFSKARRVLSREQIERFGGEMEAEKIRKQGGTPPRPQSTSQPAKSRAEDGSKAESPGVLQRIAKLVGLGDSSSGSTKKKASATKKSSASKTSSKAKPRKQAATKKSAGATKKSTTKSTSKARGTSKASTSKSGRRQASSSARTSARKTAPRSAGTKKGKGRAATKRSRAK
ncbi:MAG: hemerythrin domain-containing protein [Acidobacteriota bacterium]|nr:hemerythrin domain-containing protein [Acidobacteriota bacterium]